MKNFFKYQNYIKFIKFAKNKYVFQHFRDLKKEKGIFLRHDVDLALEPAYKMSNIESELNIKSSYFFLTTSDTYNIKSKQNQLILKKISKKNVEIGLHFDFNILNDLNKIKLSQELNSQKKLIEDIIGIKVKSLSLHNPSIKKQYPMFKYWINSYDPLFFNKHQYLSDSNMIFNIDPFDFIKKNINERIQILIHPFHFSSNGKHYPYFIKDYFINKLNALHNEFKKNIEYKKLTKGYNHNNLIKLIKLNEKKTK